MEVRWTVTALLALVHAVLSRGKGVTASVHTTMTSLVIVAVPMLVARLLLNVKTIGDGRGRMATRPCEIVSALMFAPQNDRDEGDEFESMAANSGENAGLPPVSTRKLRVEEEERALANAA